MSTCKATSVLAMWTVALILATWLQVCWQHQLRFAIAMPWVMDMVALLHHQRRRKLMLQLKISATPAVAKPAVAQCNMGMWPGADCWLTGADHGMAIQDGDALIADHPDHIKLHVRNETSHFSHLRAGRVAG